MGHPWSIGGVAQCPPIGNHTEAYHLNQRSVTTEASNLVQLILSIYPGRNDRPACLFLSTFNLFHAVAEDLNLSVGP